MLVIDNFCAMLMTGKQERKSDVYVLLEMGQCDFSSYLISIRWQKRTSQLLIFHNKTTTTQYNSVGVGLPQLSA